MAIEMAGYKSDAASITFDQSPLTVMCPPSVVSLIINGRTGKN